MLEGLPEDQADRGEQQRAEIAEGEGAKAPLGLHSRALLRRAKRLTDDQQGQRDRQQDDRDGGRAGDVAVLDLAADEDRGDLGLERDVARDQDQRAVLAERPGEGEQHAGEDAGQQVGEDDPPEDGEAAGPERGRRLLHLLVQLHQQRLHGAGDEGQGDEAEGDDDRDPGEGDVEPDRAFRPVEGEQGEAGDDRRQREGQVDQRVDGALAGELVADEDPGDDRAARRR